MAIAPTATISNICGVSQSIEPAYQNLFVKSNMSGDFTVVNAQLVHDLKARGLWDEVMVSDLKYFDGSLGQIDRIPDDLKALYATAFEIDAAWLVEAASRRQKWIDQAQSLNLLCQSGAQEAGRALSPRLAQGSEDHLLPALALGHPCGEVDAEGHRWQAQRRVGHARRRTCGSAHRGRTGTGVGQGLRHRRPRLRGLPVGARLPTHSSRRCAADPHLLHKGRREALFLLPLWEKGGLATRGRMRGSQVPDIKGTRKNARLVRPQDQPFHPAAGKDAAAVTPPASAPSSAGAPRVSVDDKRMINARADVNQLLPLKYRWAWENIFQAATTTGCRRRCPCRPTSRCGSRRTG